MKASLVTVFCEVCDKPVDRNSSNTVYLPQGAAIGEKGLLDGYYCGKWCLKKRLDK